VILLDSEKIKTMLEKKIQHPYLQQHIEQPFIDQDKIAILLAIFDEVRLTTQEKHDYIMSILLVQIALDTHDLVSNKTVSSSDELERQLRVLAGDFYSGLYYKTLADIGERHLVRVLANAIKLINEEKMVLYEYEINDWQQLMQSLQTIESALMLNVGELYQLSSIHKQYINEYLLVNRLVKELSAIHNNEFSYVKQYVDRNLVTLYEASIAFTLESEIEQGRQRMSNLANDSRFSFQALNNIMFDKQVLSAVEEG